MANRDKIESKINKLGYKIGVYHDRIDRLSSKELKKVLDAVEEDYTDVDVKVRGKDFVVEVATVDSEKDIMILSKPEYIRRYGDERWDD